MKALGYLLAAVFAGLAAFAFVTKGTLKTGLNDQIAAATADLEAKNAELQAARLDLQTRLSTLEQQLSASNAELQIKPTGPSIAETELRAKLNATEKQVAALAVKADAKAIEDAPAAPAPAEDWQARRAREMEEMKQNDPEAYKERMERRTTMRTEMKQGISERLDFFSSLDLSDLPADVQARQQQLVASMQQMGSAFDALLDNPEADLDFGAMRESMGAMNDIMQEQRGILMQDFAANLGYEGEAATELLGAIDYIREMTSPPRPSSGRGGPGGPGGR